MAKKVNPDSVYDSLPEKQQIFVTAFLKSFNATQAYITAYKTKSHNCASVEGHKLLRNPKIRNAVTERGKHIFDKSEAEVIEIIGRYLELATADIREVLSWDKDGKMSFLPSDKIKRNIVKKITVTEKEQKGGMILDRKLQVELHDPVKALDSLSRYHGMFNDTLKLEGSIDIKKESDLDGLTDEQLLEYMERKKD